MAGLPGRLVSRLCPSPALVLTCGACQHTFTPDPVAFATGQLTCPGCGGWTFRASLTGPDPAVAS